MRTLMRIAERIEWSELPGMYERKNRRGDATAKQMFLLVILAFMNGVYSTRKIEKACRTDIRFIWLLAGKRVPDHTRIARFITLMREGVMEGLFYHLVHLLKEDGEIEYAHLFVDGTKVKAYGYIYEGRSNMLIDIDTMEPVNDAGRRILEQCREKGTNPLEDETLRAIIASKYDDETAAQTALAELAEAEPEARDKKLEKLLRWQRLSVKQVAKHNATVQDMHVCPELLK